MGIATPAAADTSFLLSALLTWQEHHRPAARILVELLASPGSLLVPVWALVESYSVITRFPAPYRMRPSEARRLLDVTLRPFSRLAGFPSRLIWHLLEDFAGRGVAGGAIYDAMVFESAREASAKSFLTLDRRRYGAFDPGEIEIVIPGE